MFLKESSNLDVRPITEINECNIQYVYYQCTDKDYKYEEVWTGTINCAPTLTVKNFTSVNIEYLQRSHISFALYLYDFTVGARFIAPVPSLLLHVFILYK